MKKFSRGGGVGGACDGWKWVDSRGVSLSDFPVLVVGAGLAGLSCAVRLYEAGIAVCVVEGGDGVGGRVRTDEVEGFLLDRGFQVYLDAYPEAGRLLDLEALELRAFSAGALVYDGERMVRVMDVFRSPRHLLGSALAPIGTLMDKVRVALLRFRAVGSSEEEIGRRRDVRTEDFLRGFGFSEGMIDGFFRAFYGGIFLERELRTSSRMFEFTFKMFSEGSATVPARGMGEISQQLARRLPGGVIRLNSPVVAASGSKVLLANGEELRGSRVVIATHAAQTAELVPGFARQAPGWREVTNVYYAAGVSPLGEGIIALNGSGVGLVNNFCVISDVAPGYAPAGSSLLSVSLLGVHRDGEIPEDVREELRGWFGDQVEGWRHLRTDVIRYALPEQAPGGDAPGCVEVDGMYLCGDYLASASIEGAIVSGGKAGDAVIESFS